MKRSLLVTFLTIVTAAAPAFAQDGQRPARKKSQVKAEMVKMEDALDVVSEWLKKPEGKAPMDKVTEATLAMVEAKKHAPRATARQPEDKREEFVKNYQIEVNKVIRNLLDLEDAMLKGDHKAAAKILGGFKDMEKAGHKVFKPRRRRGRAPKQPAPEAKPQSK